MTDSAIHNSLTWYSHGPDYYSALIQLRDTSILRGTSCMTVHLHYSFLHQNNSDFLGILEIRPKESTIYNFSTDSLIEYFQPLLYQSLLNDYYISPLPLNGNSIKEREVEIKFKYNENELPYWNTDFEIKLEFIGSNGEFQSYTTESSKPTFKLKVNCYSNFKIKIDSEVHGVSEWELKAGCSDEKITVRLKRK